MSVHQAIKAELLCEEQGLKARFRPTPRALSVSCGQSVLFDSAIEQAIIQEMSKHGVVWKSLFEISESEGNISYARIGGYEDYQLE